MDMEILKMLIDPVRAQMTELANRVNGIVDRNHGELGEIKEDIGRLQGTVDVLLKKLESTSVVVDASSGKTNVDGDLTGDFVQGDQSKK